VRREMMVVVVVVMVMVPNGKKIRVGCCSGRGCKAERGRRERRVGGPAWEIETTALRQLAKVNRDNRWSGDKGEWGWIANRDDRWQGTKFNGFEGQIWTVCKQGIKVNGDGWQIPTGHELETNPNKD
jgi:hypothetical protein